MQMKTCSFTLHRQNSKISSFAFHVWAFVLSPVIHSELWENWETLHKGKSPRRIAYQHWTKRERAGEEGDDERGRERARASEETHTYIHTYTEIQIKEPVQHDNYVYSTCIQLQTSQRPLRSQDATVQAFLTFQSKALSGKGQSRLMFFHPQSRLKSHHPYIAVWYDLKWFDLFLIEGSNKQS